MDLDVVEDDEREIRLQFLLLAFILLVASLTVSVTPLTIIPPGFHEALWISFPVAAFFLLYLACPHVWYLSVPLTLTYIFSFAGVIFMGGRGYSFVDNRILEIMVGIIFIFFALGTTYMTIIHMRNVRDENADRKDATLGIWFLAMLLFPLISMMSVAVWLLWTKTNSQNHLLAHFISELLLILIAAYVLWRPESAIWYGPVKRKKKTAIKKKMKIVQKKELIEKCPVCGGKMKKIVKVCPECGEENAFYWCPVSEFYIVKCPRCHTSSIIRRKCKKCYEKVDKVKCENCGKIVEFNMWK